MIAEAQAPTKKTTHELRKEARTVFGDLGLPTAWVSLGREEELVVAIATRRIPDRFGSIRDTAPEQAPAPAPKAQAAPEDDDLRSAVHKALTGIHAEVEAHEASVKASVEALQKRTEGLLSKDEIDKRFKHVKVVMDELAKRAAGSDLERRVNELFEQHGKERVVTVEVKMPDMPARSVGRQHARFPELLKSLSVGDSPYLCGPAGSGKSHAAEEAAKALGLRFFPMSVCQATSKSDLLGYFNPTGLIGEGKDQRPVLVRTPFREAYEGGGLFLLDELDAGNANVSLILNSGLSNGGCNFPDGYVAKHADFRCVATANTWGAGADRQYIGRNQIDAATIDRFAFLEWNYDEAFEIHLSGSADWAKRVHKIRKAANDLSERIVVSTRAIIRGAIWIKAGGTVEDAEMRYIFKGARAESRSKVLQRAGMT